jgi:hypothetical protein
MVRIYNFGVVEVTRLFLPKPSPFTPESLTKHKLEVQLFKKAMQCSGKLITWKMSWQNFGIFLGVC